MAQRISVSGSWASGNPAISSPTGQRVGLLSDSDGRIAGGALAISGFSAREFGGAVQSVLRALPADAHFHVLTDPAASVQVRAWLDQYRTGSRVEVHEAPGDLEFSLWIQDPVLFREDGTAVLSPEFDRYDDRDAATMLTGAMDCIQAPSPVHVDGGNLIVHGDMVLISANAQATDAELAMLDPARRFVRVGTRLPCRAQQTRETGRPAKGWSEIVHALNVDGTRQPIFHLDHFIAPAGHVGGRPRFLVGCPRLGAKMIGHPEWPHAQAEAFDEIAVCLENQGAEVVRNPQPLVWVDRPDRHLRRWFHLPVNNVLIHGGTVLMPAFANAHWPELAGVDGANAEIWQACGLDVQPVPEVMALAEGMGGPRCMVKVTARR